MMTLIAQVDPKAVVSVADTLGGKSDRVLFIAAILVILLIGIFVARYLIQRNDVLTKKLEEISDKSIAATVESTKAGMEIARCLERVSDRLDVSAAGIKQLLERKT